MSAWRNLGADEEAQKQMLREHLNALGSAVESASAHVDNNVAGLRAVGATIVPGKSASDVVQSTASQAAQTITQHTGDVTSHMHSVREQTTEAFDAANKVLNGASSIVLYCSH